MLHQDDVLLSLLTMPSVGDLRWLEATTSVLGTRVGAWVGVLGWGAALVVATAAGLVLATTVVRSRGIPRPRVLVVCGLALPLSALVCAWILIDQLLQAMSG